MGKAKFAHTVWQWGTDNKEQFHQALREIAEVGFDTFESVKAAINVYDGDAQSFLAACREYGCKPNGFYFHINGDWDNDVEDVKRKAGFLAACDIHTINLSTKWIKNRRSTAEEQAYDLKVAREVGKILHEYDIIPCMHPHCNTTLWFENEIDQIMQNTDPEFVAFGPDTAHLVVGLCDPVEIIRRYASRVRFTHMKDIMGTKIEGKGEQAGNEIFVDFLEMGTGRVDFPAVFKVLDDVGYDGYLTAELDRSRTTNKLSAANNLAYMRANYKQD